MPLAQKLVKRLSLAMTRVEIAGSLRRGEPEVGDIDLLTVPRLNSRGQRDATDGMAILYNLAAAGVVRPGKLMGPRYQQWRTEWGIPLELYMVEPEEWGVAMVIRTGPAEFSKRCVTQRSQRGLLEDGLRVHKNRVYRRDDVELHLPLNTAEEVDFLNLAGGWVPPEERR